MTKSERAPGDSASVADRRYIWRVIAAAFFFLVVGLGAMWFHFILRERATVGLETLAPLPPALSMKQIVPNRVRLFFTSDGALLSAEMREIAPSISTYERVSAIVQVLLSGPRSSVLRSPIPDSVKIRALYVANESVTIDFSAELCDKLHGGASVEMLCLYSIVNTVLLNCPDLKTVTILIEARPVETLLGYLDLGGPLVENLALVAPEKERSDSIPY